MESKLYFKSKLYVFKLIFAVSLFFIICTFGTMVPMYSKTLASGAMPGTHARLQLISVENATNALEFQIFYSGHPSSGIAFPQDTLAFNECKPIELNQKDFLVIKCCKGSFAPVFVQDGDCASGQAPEGHDGPFYFSMWLGYPQVGQEAKVRVRYCVKTGTMGSVGLKIGAQGDYRFVAHENVVFMQ